MKRAKYWVLRWGKKKAWFIEMVDIGTRCTGDRSQAARFKTRRRAMCSPARHSPFSIFEPEAIR